MITYRDDLGRPLTSVEVDANFRELAEGKLADAPADGKEYLRKAGAWVEPSAAPAGIAEAPADGTPYARQDGEWVAFDGGGSGGIADAPADGTDYVRRDGTWTALTHPAAGIAEAPGDGTVYGRKNGAWEPVPAGTAGGGVKYDMFYDNAKSYAAGDIVRRYNHMWLSYSGSQGIGPDFGEGLYYWVPLTMGAVEAAGVSVTQNLYHSDANGNTIQSLRAVIVDLKSRIAALEAATAA
ncbi:hypothetical protein SAMN06297251_10440 [Fulvimarina manganoxydans]|uniref:Uncharacterized protein n=1 Tax=Fulvimarina manganoxydans TaxID=937218 RepID=A0A1W2A959_9HYPH|nr:hypothetical protein [Fulvimarina manganoxydans]SMC57255.1 hypothetical protein SAMN06297251_10440 [Fulvimarina manganoxydans]